MDVIDLDRRASVAMTSLIEATSVDHYDAPTPCPDWVVRDLLAHVVAGNVKYTEIAQGSDWARGVPVVDLGDDPAATYRRTSETMLQAWEQPGVLEREITLPIGRGRAESALYIHLGETLVHGWDLAKATRQEPVYDRDIVEAGLNQYMSWLPPGRPAGTPFSNAMALGDDAAPIDRLAAYLGRDVSAWPT